MSLPYTVVCFDVAWFSLFGLPFLIEFYSCDLILEFMSLSEFNLLVYFVFFISVGLTVFYSVYLIYYCLSDYVGLFSCLSHGEDMVIMHSMLFLLLMRIIGGSLMSWLMFVSPDLLVFPL